MSELKIGNKVRWVVDVEKVYSADTKTLVGKVGEIVPPRDRAWISKYQGNAPGCFDVLFPYVPNGFVVWDIPFGDLEKVNE